MNSVQISLVRFQNVDIYKRGFYRIRIRVCYDKYLDVGSLFFKNTSGREYFDVVDEQLRDPHLVFEIKYERQVLNMDWFIRFKAEASHERLKEPIMIKLYLDYAASSGQEYKCVQKRRLVLNEFKHISYERILFRRKCESLLDLIVCRGTEELHVPDHETILAMKHAYETTENQKLFQENIQAFTAIDLKSASLDCSSHYCKCFTVETRPLLSIYLDPSSSLPLHDKTSQEDGFIKFKDGFEYLKHIKEYLSIAHCHEEDMIHLVFCVPGLQGSHHDFRMMKNVCMLLNSSEKERNVYWHVCRDNDEHSFDDIHQQAANIISEVRTVVADKLFRNLSKVVISFIGYSLGGLVIRAALNSPDFPERLRDRFHMFITLATPHLGLWYNSNASLDALMNLGSKVGKKTSIEQLLMQDAEQPTETLIYKLAQQSSSLKLFKRCIFVSSVNDLYVCNHSALVEIDKRAFTDELRGNFYVQMCVNMIIHMEHVSVERLLVNFDKDERQHHRSNMIYEYLGRDEHLAYLQDYGFISSLSRILFP